MLAGSISFSRAARISVSAFFFITGLCFASWASRIPDIQHHLQLNEAQLGGVLFALPIGLMVSMPVAGFLVTKFGSRIVMLTGAIVYSGLLCLLGTVDTTWQLTMILFFYGMSGNMMNISINTQAVGVEALYQRSIMASFHGLWSVAGFTGAAIGTFMVSQDVSPLIHFISIAGLIILLACLMFPYALQNEENRQSARSGISWPDKPLLKLGIIAFCCMACEGCMFDWSGIYFRDMVKAPQQLVPLGYTAFMAMMATGRFVGDRLITRIGVKQVMVVSGCLITIGLSSAIIFPNIYVATVGFLLTGFGVSSIVPMAFGLAGKSKTMAPGLAIAAVSTVGFLGFLFGPPVIGYIAKAASLRWSFALIALFGSLIIFLSGKVKAQ